MTGLRFGARPTCWMRRRSSRPRARRWPIVASPRRGFYAYITEPIPAGELTPLQRTNKRLSDRMGFGGQQWRNVERIRFDTKAEAKRWAYDKFTEARTNTTTGGLTK